VDEPPQRLSDSLYSGNDHFHHAFPRFIETYEKYQHFAPSVNENEEQEKSARAPTGPWQDDSFALFVPYLWLFLRASVLKTKIDTLDFILAFPVAGHAQPVKMQGYNQRREDEESFDQETTKKRRQT
jgi:hypothetical protein